MTRVLITDDQADLRRLLRWSLDGGNMDITEAVDGDQAIQLARSTRPDVMILDVMLPGSLDGLQVCRLIKADAGLAGTRILLLSARGQAADIRRGTDAGADAYVVKPFSPQQLRETVERLLAERKNASRRT
jgi:two-component system phosphate regulon response regulator PhoB